MTGNELTSGSSISFSGTPDATDASNSPIYVTIMASDGYDTVTAQLEVTVILNNSPNLAYALVNQTAIAGKMDKLTYRFCYIYL
jgi:hypothetical protein